MKTVLVTGGAGFIGSCFVRQWIAEEPDRLVNLDKLTYAGNLDSLAPVAGHPNYQSSSKATSATVELVDRLLAEHRPRAIVNFAAESHVDRSIDGPAEFVRTNVVGTCELLGRRSRLLVDGLAEPERSAFRFLHVSTDEVYGSLGASGAFTEQTPLCAQFALRGLKGGLGPFRAGLSPHLRAAGADDQLLEQLRSLSVSRKADSADDPQRPGRQAAARLRRWPAGARLAVRRRPLPGDSRGARPGPRRRNLQHRRQLRAGQPAKS